MSAATNVGLLLADNDNNWFGHMNMNGGWWIVMGLGMILFSGLVILAIVWLVREFGGPREHRGSRADDPVAVLDRRLADGTISPDEYRQRRAALSDAPLSPHEDE